MTRMIFVQTVKSGPQTAIFNGHVAGVLMGRKESVAGAGAGRSLNILLAFVQVPLYTWECPSYC